MNTIANANLIAFVAMLALVVVIGTVNWARTEFRESKVRRARQARLHRAAVIDAMGIANRAAPLSERRVA